MNIIDKKLSAQGFARCVPSHQRGMATILIALLVGVAATATSLSILHSIRNTQERQLSAHAQTHSQGAVWAAVEALRLHFLTMDEALLTAFSAQYTAASPVNIDGILDSNDTLNAYVVSMTPNAEPNVDPDAAVVYDGTYNVTMHIAAIDSAAQSASNIEVVYKVKPLISSDTRLLKPGIHLRKQSGASGSVKTNIPEGADFQVEGDMTLSSGSVTTDMGARALGIIGATGDVTISSAIHADKVHSNGNVDISASATATEIWAAGEVADGKGRVEISGDSGVVDDLWANGDIDIASDGEFKVVRGRGTVSVSRNAQLTNYVKASSELFTTAPFPENRVTIGGVAEAGNIYAKGAVLYGDNDNPNGQLISQASVSCGGRVPANGVDAPLVTDCLDTSGNPISATGSVVVTPVGEVTKFEMPPPHIIDTFLDEGKAHYAFSHVDGKDQVKVSKINGIAAGNYFVGTVGVGKREYICDAVDDAGKCLGPYIYSPNHLYNGGDKVLYDGVIYTIGNQGHGAPSLNNRAWVATVEAPAAINPLGSLCGKAENAAGGCFGYTAPDVIGGIDNNGGWTVDSSAGIAPGIVWFDTHVAVEGVMFNTVLSLGDISASGTNPTVVAVNWAGQDVMCDLAASFTYINATSTTEVLNGQLVYDDLNGNNDGENNFDEIVFIDKNTTTVSIAANKYGEQYPTDFCGLSGDEWNFEPIGSNALMAGSYVDIDPNDDDSTRAVYQGGHISIASGSEILGMVMAGDIITTGGNTVIYGYLTSSGLGGGQGNAIGASTTLDTRFLSDEMKDILGQWTSTTTPAVAAEAEVIWSLYR